MTLKKFKKNVFHIEKSCNFAVRFVKGNKNK